MSKSLFLLLFVFSLSSMVQKLSLKEVRSLYQQAESSEEVAEDLLERLETAGKEEPVLLAYKASGTMLMAKHVFSPFSKMSYFKKGKKLLQQAVNADPENVEIRFLRFALQDSTPGFLGYKNFMEVDKDLLLRELPKVQDRELKLLILPFLINSDYLTEDEKQELERLNE